MRDIVAAQLALWRAWRRVRREPVGTLTMRALVPTESVSGEFRRAQSLAAAMVRVARYAIPRPKCLVVALALQDLLTRHGILGSEIRVGVRQRAGAFAAHAWVRWGDHVLGDDAAHIATFTEVEDLRVLAGA